MMINKKQSNGFSLVELMVAMVVGLIIMGGAMSMNWTTRKIQKVNEMQMDMVADARFAIEMIAYDLRHAGSWGGTNKTSLIECKSTDAACTAVPTAADGDCVVAPAWAYNLALPVFATDGSAGNPYSDTCIPVDEKYLADTDILEVRYADANLPTLKAGQAYVRSNFLNGRVFVGATAPTLDAYDTSALTQNHELHAYAYYVSAFTDKDDDGIPSLRRVSLMNDPMGPMLKNQVLLSGVTDLQVQFGIDLGNDNIIDRYVDPDDVPPGGWVNVYAAKIWLLMRSDKKQQGVDTKKLFSIAGAAPAPYGEQDGFRYFLVTSVINLRNMKQL